jgi:hypothetical protein
MKLETIVMAGAAVLLLGSCSAGEWPETPRPTAVRSARDVYAAGAVSDPAALRAWEDASRRALRSGLRIAPSFRERIAFPPGEPHAIAYRFTMVRGQSLRVRITSIGAASELFADAFHYMGSDVFRPVHWAEQSAYAFTLVARMDGEYVLRIQPPMQRAGTYEVAVLGDASLMFPVEGRDASSIGSVFGDPRESGARAHEGVDIFAPRGTRVVAVADGYIETSQNTPTGGLVIWQQDASSDLKYYYAHLDELIAREGTRVRAGDVIGRVGNTGNARGAQTHLHYAIYRPGTIPLDPAPMLAATTAPGDVAIDGRSLGFMTRVTGDRVRLRRSPTTAGSIIMELSSAVPLLVIGDTGDWQRVVLPDGTSGFVASWLTDASYSDRQP